MSTILLGSVVVLLAWIGYTLRKLSVTLAQQEPTALYPAFSKAQIDAAHGEATKASRDYRAASTHRDEMVAKYEGNDNSIAASPAGRPLEPEYYDAMQRATQLFLEQEDASTLCHFMIEANIRVLNGTNSIAQVCQEYRTKQLDLILERTGKIKEFNAQFERKTLS